VAIINTVDDRDSISTTESIVAFLGDSQERAEKVCNEASCLAEIGRKVNADYVAQARIGRFNGQLAVKNGGDCKYTKKETSARGNVTVTEYDDCATDVCSLHQILRVGIKVNAANK